MSNSIDELIKDRLIEEQKKEKKGKERSVLRFVGVATASVLRFTVGVVVVATGRGGGGDIATEVVVP